jgi:hypothetical protein
MNALPEPDWIQAKNTLLEESRKTIHSFAKHHASEVCSFFAFSADYCFGNVAICIDTHENSLVHAKRDVVRILKDRDSMLNDESGWQNAKYCLQRESLRTHGAHTANFKYAQLSLIHFSDWEPYFLSDQHSDQIDPIGHVIVFMNNTIHELVSAGIFDRLQMSSPFRIGAEFPEDLGLIVMRLLRW